MMPYNWERIQEAVRALERAGVFEHYRRLQDSGMLEQIEGQMQQLQDSGALDRLREFQESSEYARIQELQRSGVFERYLDLIEKWRIDGTLDLLQQFVGARGVTTSPSAMRKHDEEQSGYADPELLALSQRTGLSIEVLLDILEILARSDEGERRRCYPA